MKITHKSNYRVAAYPTPPGVFPGLGSVSGIPWREGEELKACRAIRQDIERHVDGVHGICIECDAEEVCEFCDRAWETDDDGSPACCNEAHTEWLANQTEEEAK